MPDSVCELFAEIFLGVVVILLLNVMEVLNVDGCAPLDIRIWYSKECVYCACDPRGHLDVPSIGLFVLGYVGSYLLI